MSSFCLCPLLLLLYVLSLLPAIRLPRLFCLIVIIHNPPLLVHFRRSPISPSGYVFAFTLIFATPLYFSIFGILFLRPSSFAFSPYRSSIDFVLLGCLLFPSVLFPRPREVTYLWRRQERMRKGEIKMGNIKTVHAM